MVAEQVTERSKTEYDGTAELNEESSRLARRFKVSSLVILRRIHDTGAITREEFWQAYEQELARLRAIIES
jgi:Zn-dependent peptidase ImmA (M78 family)